MTDELPKIEIGDLRKVTKYKDNPLVETKALTFKEKKVRAGRLTNLADTETGEIVGGVGVYVCKVVDEEEFVKVFADGVKRSYDLNSPGFKLLQVVLRLYHAQPGRNQDQVYVHAQDAIEDPVMPISERTFQRGLKELLKKRFLANTTRPGWYWTNPHLFFKGDRAAFMTEYVKRKTVPGGGDPELDQQDLFTGETKRERQNRGGNDA